MNYAEDEKTLDLKQMLYYVLKHWKQIILFLLIGVLLGSGFSLLNAPKTLDDLSENELKNLNMEQIDQYLRAEQLYDLQAENNSKSVILQMDPAQVYKTQRSYFFTIPAECVNLISQRYSVLLSDADVLDALIAASGLDCSRAAIRELVSLSFATVNFSSVSEQLALLPESATLSLSATAPDEETGEALLNALDFHAIALKDSMAGEYEITVEKLNDSQQFGYDAAVQNAQKAAAEALKKQKDELAALKNAFGTNEKLYYNGTYQPEQLHSSPVKQAVKYAVLAAAALVFVSLGCYVILFLLDDHIKTAHEATDYGLYTIACLRTNEKQKQDIVDKLFSSSALPENSREYLLNAAQVLCTGKTVLCGNMQDAGAAEIMNWLGSQMENLCVTDRLAMDPKGLLTARESEGAILVIRLWKTTSFDLKRELQALKQIDKPVKGVVVLRG